ncbi:hypothetical protein [Roseibium sp. SCP14]|uniref:hypothetical protein n=1 Tax=Roseibium sp. SCP14 TaxID=3141375 RepID=UPI003337D17A
MERSQQKQWFTDLLEGLPSIAFILLWRQMGDLELAGWIGSGLALFVFGAFFHLKSRMHPVLLGVNAHILVATPLIVSLFRFGDPALAKTLITYSHGGVLVTVLLAGVLQTLFANGGFAGLPEMPRSQQRRYSLLMLAITALGAGWVVANPVNSLVPVVATLTLLIGGRRYLLARLVDKSHSERGLVVAGLTASEPQLADSAA